MFRNLVTSWKYHITIQLLSYKIKMCQKTLFSNVYTVISVTSEGKGADEKYIGEIVYIPCSFKSDGNLHLKEILVLMYNCESMKDTPYYI